LQREKDRIQKKLDRREADHNDLSHRFDQLLAQNDHYAANLIKSLHKELGDDDAEFDDDDVAREGMRRASVAVILRQTQTSDATR